MRLFFTAIFVLEAFLLSAQLKHVAITFDGIPIAGKEVNLDWTMHMNLNGSEAVKQAEIPITGFVNEGGLINPHEREQRLAIVETWLQSGMKLGNGTFSNIPIDQVKDTEWFIKDTEFGERFLRARLEESGDTLRYFRFPEMQLGHDSLRLAQVNAYLDQKGYIPVTATMRIEDEFFNTTYINAKIENDTAVVRYVGDAYVNYFLDMLDYYQKLSQKNFGTQITHILSLRNSEINNDLIGYFIYLLWMRGFRFVPLDQALADPLYDRLPKQLKGGFFWEYADRVEVSPPPDIPPMIKSLYRRQTY